MIRISEMRLSLGFFAHNFQYISASQFSMLSVHFKVETKRIINKTQKMKYKKETSTQQYVKSIQNKQRTQNIQW